MATENWLQAQYSVLGSALIAPELIPRIMAETGEGDYTGTCLTVYKAIRKLFLKGVDVDPVSLVSALGDGYSKFLMQLMDITPTAANLGTYIALCHEQAKIVKARDVAAQIAQEDNWEKISKLLDDAGRLNVSRSRLKITNMEDGLKSFFDRHSRKQIEYLSWPVPELNDVLYTELGDFVIIGGYPSAGKSAWALQCAWHWAQKYKVGFFSFETSSEKLFDRQMAAVAGINMRDIKRNTITSAGWDKLAGMNPEIIDRNLELIPAAGMTVEDIRAVTMMRQYQIILVDYAQLIQGRGENRTAIVTAISIALHTMAQSLGVTVVALSQLARPSKDQKGRAPDMSDLRESGQLEQDADLIMMLSLSQGENPDNDRDLRIRKNKEGTCPNIRLAFDGTHQIFTKAQNTGSVASHYAAEGRKAKRANQQAAQAAGQLSLLPSDYPVPF